MHRPQVQCKLCFPCHLQWLEIIDWFFFFTVCLSALLFTINYVYSRSWSDLHCDFPALMSIWKKRSIWSPSHDSSRCWMCLHCIKNFPFPHHWICKWSDICKDHFLTFDQEPYNRSRKMLATSLITLSWITACHMKESLPDWTVIAAIFEGPPNFYLFPLFNPPKKSDLFLHLEVLNLLH